MEKEIMVLNILGQVCPACLLVALKEINTHSRKLKQGDAELIIRTDHRDATRTIPDTARAMGYGVGVHKIMSYYEIRIGARSKEAQEK